jgi:hypothetical protein
METEVTMKNTKKEMLEIISNLQKEMEHIEKAALNPQKIKQEQKEVSVIQRAEAVVKSDLNAQMNSLKTAIAKELSEISDKFENEISSYKNLLEATDIKKKELETIYGIEREALSLTLLIESQKKQKEDFELSFKQRQGNLNTEINAAKLNWEKEKKDFIEASKEQKTLLDKERKREAEEYDYKTNREREIERNKYADEIEKVKKDITAKKEEYEKFYQTKTEEIVLREEAVSEREKKMSELEKTVEAYPEELEKAVNKAIADTEKRISNDFQKNEILLSQTHVGEINVLNAKIAAFEATVKDQAKQIEKLAQSQEKAYDKVQSIANKAVEGAAERLNNITVKVPKTEV